MPIHIALQAYSDCLVAWLLTKQLWGFHNGLAFFYVVEISRLMNFLYFSENKNIPNFFFDSSCHSW